MKCPLLLSHEMTGQVNSGALDHFSVFRASFRIQLSFCFSHGKDRLRHCLRTPFNSEHTVSIEQYSNKRRYEELKTCECQHTSKKNRVKTKPASRHIVPAAPLQKQLNVSLSRISTEAFSHNESRNVTFQCVMARRVRWCLLLHLSRIRAFEISTNTIFDHIPRTGHEFGHPRPDDLLQLYNLGVRCHHGTVDRIRTFRP